MIIPSGGAADLPSKAPPQMERATLRSWKVPVGVQHVILYLHGSPHESHQFHLRHNYEGTSLTT